MFIFLNNGFKHCDILHKAFWGRWISFCKALEPTNVPTSYIKYCSGHLFLKNVNIRLIVSARWTDTFLGVCLFYSVAPLHHSMSFRAESFISNKEEMVASLAEKDYDIYSGIHILDTVAV